jgi:hypothetical protein
MTEVNCCFMLGSSTTHTVSTCWGHFTEDQQYIQRPPPLFFLQKIGNYGLVVSANLLGQIVHPTLFIHTASKPYQRTTKHALHEFEISSRCVTKCLYQYLRIYSIADERKGMEHLVIDENWSAASASQCQYNVFRVVTGLWAPPFGGGQRHFGCTFLHISTYVVSSELRLCGGSTFIFALSLETSSNSRLHMRLGNEPK